MYATPRSQRLYREWVTCALQHCGGTVQSLGCLAFWTAKELIMSRAAGLRAALLLVSVWTAPNFAHALTLSAEPGPDCFSANPDKCIGGIYTLDIASAGGNTYIATYTMDLTVGLELPATTIEQIDFKVATEYGTTFTVLSGPGGAGNWTSGAGPLTGSGCSGSNGGFICLDAANPVSVALSTYSWAIRFDADALIPESDWHIGARFASPTHERGWILSASQAPIPEPRSTAMFLLGGLVVAFIVRKQVLTARC